MIEVLPETSGNILAVKASGKLTDADYQEVFIPKMEDFIKQYGKIRILCIFVEDFAGWEPKAFWDDAKFGVKHRNDIEKMAIVGGKKWMEWGGKLSAYFMAGELRSFNHSQLDSAWEWVKA